MIGYVAQRLMEVDVEGLIGAAHGERSEDRENWRNGYRERDWHTRGGSIALKMIAGAVNSEGRREVLGMASAPAKPSRSGRGFCAV
jgi:transposase-like protein